MRDGFRNIISGWTLIAGLDDLTDRIDRAAEWTKANGPLEPDEQATIDLMIRCQVARGLDERPIALWVTPRGGWIGPRKEGPCSGA